MTESISRREFVRRASLLGLGLSSAAGLFQGCSEQKGAPKGSPIRLGALVPLTGVAEILGLQMRNNAVLAAEEINQAGGVLGRPIELLVADTETSPVAAVEQARKLIRSDGVVALVGTLTSSERWAVAMSVSGPERMPYINSTYYEGGICVPFFFNTGGLPNQQVDPFIPWLIETKKVRTFFLGGSDYSWPRGTFRAVKEAVKRAEGQVLGEQYSPLGSADFSATLAQIESLKPDVVFPLYVGEDGVRFFQQFLRAKLAERCVVASSALHETVIVGLPAEWPHPWYCSSEYFMAVDNQENKDFIRRYRARFGEAAILDAIGMAMYATVFLFARAVEKAGSTEREALAAGIDAVQLHTPKGLLHMDGATRCAYLNDYIAEIQPGRTPTPESRFRIVATFTDIRPQQDCLDGPAR